MEDAMAGSVTSTRCETLEDGREAEEFALDNGNGMTVLLGTYGARLHALHLPDRLGKVRSLVLGHDRLRDWVADDSYLGATIGRYANRIAGGRFTLDGQTHQVPVNDPSDHPQNALHGGPRGFDRMIWQAMPEAGAALTFTLVSPDGDSGFPGRLTTRARYALLEENALAIDYEATTDAPTVLNLTNHSYFNLNGDGRHTILDHLLQIDAEAFTPVDDTLIPTGESRPVAGSPFDFRNPRRIGARIDDLQDDQLRIARGYDHNFVLRPREPGETLRFAARLQAARSGLAMEVWTTEPGVQVYSGNFLTGQRRGRGGVPLGFRSGMCLETQHFPNSPNRPDFPTTVLRPGEVFRSRTVYRFSRAG
jgi:aldose 1-epimerase